MRDEYIKILDIILKINKRTEYAAFYSYSGHVDNISVAVTASKKDFTNNLYVANCTVDFHDVYKNLEEFLEVSADV